MARPCSAIPTEPHNVRLHLYLYEIVKREAQRQGVTIPRYLTGLIHEEMERYPNLSVCPIHPLAGLYLPTRENSEKSASPAIKLYLREGLFLQMAERAEQEGVTAATVRTGLILDGLERRGVAL